MKLQLITIMILLTLSSALGAGSPMIQITSEQVNMKSGETGYLKMTITNQGSNPAYNLQLVMTNLDSPLSSSKLCTNCNKYSTSYGNCLEYNTNCYINLGDITGNSYKTYTMPIVIPANVTDKYYTTNMQIKYQNDTLGTTTQMEYVELLEITELENNPDLSIKSIELSDNEIQPGEEFNLTITIENNGLSEAENVKVILDSESFNTINTANNIRVDNIKGESNKEVNFRLISDDSLEVGVHQADITIEYSTGGEEFTSEGNFGIKVGNQDADFGVFMQTITQTTAGIKIDVRLANLGLIDAKSVSIDLSGEGINLGDVNSNYIGDLTSGSYAKASFTLASYATLGTTTNRTRQMNGSFPQGGMPPAGMNNTRPGFNQTNTTLGGIKKIFFSINYTNLLGQRISEKIEGQVNFDQLTGSATIGTISTTRQTTTQTFDWTTIISTAFTGVMLVIVVYFFAKTRRKSKKRGE